MSNRTMSLVIAGAFAAAVGSLTAGTAVADMKANIAKTEAAMKTGKFDMCYGVALKGQNDCAAAPHSCAGTSTKDYQGDVFKLVAKGTCVTMKTPKGMGSLEPQAM